MNKLRVKNFGPITTGYNGDDGLLSLPKVTVFCGPQGSGKSSLTKLFSLLSWLEKSIYRDPGLRIDNGVFLRALEWQNIVGYIQAKTEIDYHGELLHFSYKDGNVSAEIMADAYESYVVPKISYMPAERNFASIVRNASRVEGLPLPLIDMQVEFDKAKRFYAQGFKLPANGYKFRFDDEPWIVNGNESNADKTRLDVASSGLQSMVPMLLVSQYLNEHLSTENGLKPHMGLFYDSGTAEKKARVESYRSELRQNQSLTVEQKQLRLERYFAPGSRFINIVEEPEQNLYPDTQCEVINRLLSIAKNVEKNSLVLSTHSPYVINALVASQMAAEILSISNDPVTVEKVASVYPVESAIAKSGMALYELTDKGEITLLPTEADVFSDANLLNAVLGKWNDSFDQLLEIEARLNG